MNYKKRVDELEKEGCTTSDAQAIADSEFKITNEEYIILFDLVGYEIDALNATGDDDTKKEQLNKLLSKLKELF